MNVIEFTKNLFHKLDPSQVKAYGLGKVKWSQEKLANGMLIEYDGDEITQSSIIYEVAPDGSKSLLPDGQYRTKDGVLFELTDGKVSSVDDTANQSVQSDEPIKQAQSSVEENPTNMNLPIKKPVVKAPAKAAPAATVAAPVAPVKQDEAEDMATEDPTDVSDSSDDATSVQEILEQALAPITAQLTQILSALGSTTEMAKTATAELAKVKEAQKKTEETVTKLAEEPAPEKAVTKEIKNPFHEKVADPSESRTSQIFKSIKPKK